MADNIPQFEARGNLTPANEGVSAYEMMGRRVGELYHEEGAEIGKGVGQLGGAYVNHMTQEDIVHGGAAVAEMFGNIQNQWNEFASNPANVADHAKVDAFRQGIGKQAEEFVGHFRTQESQMWASSRMNELQQHMYEKTASDASTMAGIAAMQATQSTVNQYAASAHQDFTSLDFALGSLDATVGATAKTIGDPVKGAVYSSEMNEKGKAAIVMDAFYGLADRNPEQALSLIHSDPRAQQYLSDTQRHEIEDYAKSSKNAAITDQLRQRQLLRDQQEDTSTAKAGDYLTSLSTANTSDPNFLPNWNKAVLSDRDLLPSTRESMMAMGQRLVTDKTENINRGNPEQLDNVVHDLASGKPYTDAQIYDMVKPNGLSVEQAETLVRIAHPKTAQDEMGNKMLEADMQLWKTKLEIPSLQTGAPADLTQYNQAVTFYMPLIKAGIQRGVPMEELLAPPDPSHPNSIYHTKLIESFAPSAQQHASHATGNPNAAPQVNIWDQVSQVWQRFRAGTGEGEAVTVPIAGSVQGQYNSITAPKPGQKSLDDIFSGN